MIDAILTILGEWSRLAQAKPIRTSLGGMAIALAALLYLGALARARFELRALRVSTGPLFALAGLLVLALSLVVALVDALLAHYDMLLLEERVLLLLAPGEGRAAYEALRRILGLAAGGRFVLPGPVHSPLALLLGAAVYLGLVFWAARTLEDGSLEQKPDDVLARERLEQQKAIAKALAEGRPLPAEPVQSAPLADNRFGRVFKLLGHWTSVEFVEARFVRWQGPLVFALAGLAALALPAALAGHFPAPLSVGAAIALDGLRRNLSTPSKSPTHQRPRRRKSPAPRPPLRPLVESIHAAQGPLLLPRDARRRARPHLPGDRFTCQTSARQSLPRARRRKGPLRPSRARLRRLRGTQEHPPLHAATLGKNHDPRPAPVLRAPRRGRERPLARPLRRRRARGRAACPLARRGITLEMERPRGEHRRRRRGSDPRFPLARLRRPRGRAPRALRPAARMVRVPRGPRPRRPPGPRRIGTAPRARTSPCSSAASAAPRRASPPARLRAASEFVSFAPPTRPSATSASSASASSAAPCSCSAPRSTAPRGPRSSRLPFPRARAPRPTSTPPCVRSASRSRRVFPPSLLGYDDVLSRADVARANE